MMIGKFMNISRRLVVLMGGLLLSFFSIAASAATYYLYTPITGANTTFDSSVSSIWQFNVLQNFDFGGGTFTIKQGGSAMDDAHLSICTALPVGYTGGDPCPSAGGNLVTTTSLSRANVSGQYTPRTINFPTPVTLSAASYYVVLWSATATSGKFQYFIKGANAAFVGDSNQIPISGSFLTLNNLGPNFTLSKSGSPTSVSSGGAISYTLGIGNSGSAISGTTVTIADQMPAGVTATSVTAGTGVSGVSCSNLGYAGALVTCSVTLSSGLAAGAANGSATITLHATAPSTAGTITNYASVDAGGGNAPPAPSASCSPATSCSSASTTVNSAANFVLSKSVSATTVLTGSAYSYTLTVTNNGSASSGATASISEALPAGLTGISATSGTGNAVNCGTMTAGTTANCTLTFSSGSLAAGASSSFTINATAPTTASTVVNYASVATTTGGTPPTPGSACTTNNCASVTTIASAANLTLTKTANVTSVATGGQIVYTITMTNSGSATIPKTLFPVVKDLLPDGVTYVSSAVGTSINAVSCVTTSNPISCTVTLGNNGLNAAQSGTFTITVTAPSTSGPITNYAAVDPAAGSATPTPGNACAPAASCGSATVYVGSNLTMSKTATASVAANGTITYTMNLGNSGGVTSGTSATFYDQLPAGVYATATNPGTGVSSVSCSPLNTPGALLTCSTTLSSGLPANSANGTARYTIIAIAPSATGSITNYASVDPTGGFVPPIPGPSCVPATSCGSAGTTVTLGV
ncbi:MAG: hypothetical protein WCT35_09410, partial [Sideroxydans sp.]